MRKEEVEKEYRKKVLDNKEEYPNLYNLEIKKNKWKFNGQWQSYSG